MLRHLGSFLVRLRFRVYRQYSAAQRLRMAFHALAMHPGPVARRAARRLADVPTRNAILMERAECEAAEGRVLELGLVPHYSRTKNWDFLRAAALVHRECAADEAVLDAGSGAFSVVLEWLEMLGHRRLYGCDFFVQRPGRRGAIEYSRQDLTATSFPDAAFGAITCLSVIEHNVDLDRFLREAFRLLAPGGVLVVSTDYWPEKIDTKGVRPYGEAVGDTRVFDRGELEAFVELALDVGFEASGPMPLDSRDRVVRWRAIPQGYTFAFVWFRRPSSGGVRARA